jgi:hypothetical protein
MVAEGALGPDMLSQDETGCILVTSQIS